MTAFQILVVCANNVCRSPFAAGVLAQSIQAASLERTIAVRPSGVHATPGQPMCPQMAEIARARKVSQEVIAAHRANRVRATMVAEADLVLTTDRGVRAEVLRIAPMAHGRTFTMRQAAELAREAIEKGHRPDDLNTVTTLRWFVNQLNSLRGLTDTPQIERVRIQGSPWKRLALHSHDIPDAHQGVEGLHRTVAHLIVPTTETLARCLTGVVRP